MLNPSPFPLIYDGFYKIGLCCSLWLLVHLLDACGDSNSGGSGVIAGAGGSTDLQSGTGGQVVEPSDANTEPGHGLNPAGGVGGSLGDSGAQEIEPVVGGSLSDSGGQEIEPVVTSTELTFSHQRGFYQQAFDLTVNREAGGRLIYTLDGSDPRTSSSAREQKLPARIRIDPDDTTDRFTAPAVVLRAYCPEQGDAPELVTTHTFLYFDRVRDLSPDGQSPGNGWPPPAEQSFRGRTADSEVQRMDYGMDPDVTNDPAYSGLLEQALLDIPTVSLVSDLANFFDRQTGIFVNAEERGREWERFGSLELLLPNGEPGFQINTGIRIRGGYSRIGTNPKHAFRLFFRGDYGAKRLRYPLFGDEGVSSFDKIDFRTSQNYSWSYQGDYEQNKMNRDVFSRDLQRELGRPYTRSRYYHLYLNGVYWGLFQSQERSEAAFGESYLGGNEADYDIVKPDRELDLALEASDGNLNTWNEIFSLCQAGFRNSENYYRIQGLDANGVRDPSLNVLVDIENLIDYMLIIFYTANFDAPVSKFYDNQRPNNFFAMYNRGNPDTGFIFFAHDNEHTLHADRVRPTIGVQENRVNIAEVGIDETGRVDDTFRMRVNDPRYFHPQWLHHRLTENADYRDRFAARARQLLEGLGPMTPEPAARLFTARIKEIELAIIAESARWGDAHESRAANPHTKNGSWLPAVNRVLDGFFPVRTRITIDQLKEMGLYPE